MPLSFRLSTPGGRLVLGYTFDVSSWLCSYFQGFPCYSGLQNLGEILSVIMFQAVSFGTDCRQYLRSEDSNLMTQVRRDPGRISLCLMLMAIPFPILLSWLVGQSAPA